MAENETKETPFCAMVRASGLAEVWTHTHDKLKFREFGWRSTSNDTAYQNQTLIGNWNEERFDIQERRKASKLPSPYQHYFDTIYDTSYNSGPPEVPEVLKHLKGRDPHAYPSHQPELDHPTQRASYKQFLTTQRTSYVHPNLQTQPAQQQV